MFDIDPTLQIDSAHNHENETPGEGVQGKTRMGTESGWGGPSENDTQIRFPSLDKEDFNVSSENRFPSLDNTVKDVEYSFPSSRENSENFFSKNNSSLLDKENKDVVDVIPQFYEVASDFMSDTDRAIVDPKVLATKLLSKSDYKPEYCENMVEFFLTRAKSRVLSETHYTKNGHMYEHQISLPNPPPMFSEFGRKIGVSERTLKGWAKKNAAFAEAYEICQDIIQEFFVENGVTGRYSSQFAIFAAKNLTKMKDILVNKNENYDMKSILDQIEKGIITSDD